MAQSFKLLNNVMMLANTSDTQPIKMRCQHFQCEFATDTKAKMNFRETKG